MKKLNFLLSLLLVAGLLVALPALAAQTNSSESQPMNQMESQSSMGQSQAMNSQPFNAKDLLGKTVKDQKGKSIGKVADLVIGNDGRADFVILSRGGFFSSGKYTPVPFKTFISSATNLNRLRKDRDLKTNLSKAMIDKAPTYSRLHLNLMSSQKKICSYYGMGQCNGMGG